jgi:hypothetical protein
MKGEIMKKFRTLGIYLSIGFAVSVVISLIAGETITQFIIRIGIVELMEFIVWLIQFGDSE